MALKSTDVELHITLCYQTDSPIAYDHAEPEDFVLTVNGEIYGFPISDEETGIEGKGIKLGELKSYIIQTGKAADSNETIGYICDAYHETMEAGSTLFNFATNDFRPLVHKTFPDADLFPLDDILLLCRLTLHPVVRGQCLGLAVIRQTMEDWSKGCSLVVMKPYPLQFEARAKRSTDWNQWELGKFPASRKVAFDKLRNYYQRLGFKRIGRSEFYALPTEQSLPSTEELGISKPVCVPLEFLRSIHVP